MDVENNWILTTMRVGHRVEVEAAVAEAEVAAATTVVGTTKPLKELVRSMS